MNKLKHKIEAVILSLFVLLGLTGCFTERIELDLNQGGNKKLVIEAWITDADERQEINLSYTSDYFDSLEVEYVEDATVVLTYQNETVEATHRSKGNYFFPSDWRAIGDIEYDLSVTHNEVTYSATSILDSAPVLENVYWEEAEYEEEDTTYYEILFSFQETMGLGDGYFVIDYKKNSLKGDSIAQGGFVDDEFFEGTLTLTMAQLDILSLLG